MKNHSGKSLYVLSFIACILLFANCTKKDVYDPSKGKEELDDLFDFATTTNTELKVDYGVKGYKAMFEIYTEDPVTITKDPVTGTENDFVKKEGVEAVFKAYTDNDCLYIGKINLPTASKKVYIYSEAFGLPRSVEAEVTSSGINFNLKEYITKQPLQKNLSRANDSYTFDTPFGSNNPYNIKSIGNWDKTGKPDYLENDAIIPDGLIKRIQKTLPSGNINNSSYARPTDTTNINVLENAKISLIFVSEWAGWKNSLGYYYYPTGTTLTRETFDALPKYIALPNCTVFGCLGGDENSSPLQPGNKLKLKYYGTDYKAEASDNFPAGVTIGWFLLPAGFEAGTDTQAPKINPKGHGNWGHVVFSNLEFNQNPVSSCVSLYDRQSSKVIIGFEDGGNNTFNDVLFYIEATPDAAIFDPTKPPTNPEDYDPTITKIKGTIAFEDLWPRQGDYDMNDVVIAYNSVVTKNKDNKVTKIVDTFTPVYQGGTFPSAFGYQLGISTTKVTSVNIVNGSSSAIKTNNMEANQEKATIMLFDDIHNVTLGENITVTIQLDGTETEETILFPPYNPFICVGEFIPGKARKEVHLPKHEPTSLVNKTFFGQYDDCTYIEKSGMYVNNYMTTAAYPFAINLPVSNYKVSLEGKPIDTSYPKFKSWAESKGAKDQDWYLHPKEK